MTLTALDANRTTLRLVGKLILEDHSLNTPAPFNRRMYNDIMTEFISVLKNASPFIDHPERMLDQNPARWKATWEDMLVVASEVLTEKE
jgi:hypothetical protein